MSPLWVDWHAIRTTLIDIYCRLYSGVPVYTSRTRPTCLQSRLWWLHMCCPTCCRWLNNPLNPLLWHWAWERGPRTALHRCSIASRSAESCSQVPLSFCMWGCVRWSQVKCSSCLSFVVICSLCSREAGPGLAGSPRGPPAPQQPVWPVRQGLPPPPAAENSRWRTTPVRSLVTARHLAGSLQPPRSERCPLSLRRGSCCGWRAASPVGGEGAGGFRADRKG